jgi:hypothetical protein
MLKVVLQFEVFAIRRAAIGSDCCSVMEFVAEHHILHHNIILRFVVAWPTTFYSPAFISNHQVFLPLHRQNI